MNQIIHNNKFILGNKKIIYHSCPKNACTSVKTMIMRIFGDDRSNETHRPWPHTIIRCEDFSKKQDFDIRLCIIRDPVERFTSAYINRVVHRKQMPYVDFDDFVENFPIYYKKYGSINWHLSQQSRFIGSDMSYYTHIYDVSEVSKVAELLTGLSGVSVSSIREQSSKKYEKPILTKDQERKVKDYFKQDYAIFSKIGRYHENFSNRA
jgi:hypothetical protein